MYTTLKVKAVTSDSVFVHPDIYQSAKANRVFRLDKTENYTAYAYGISRNTLKEMHENGIIAEVQRN